MKFKNRTVSLTIFLFSIFFLTACSVEGQPIPNLSPEQRALLYNSPNNIIDGNPNGNITMVEFFDYQCPYCRKMTPVVEQLKQNDPQLRVIYKEYLLFGPISELPARAALAAQFQGKYLALHKAMMNAEHPLSENEIMQLAASLNIDTKKLAKDMTNPEVTKQLQENEELATQLKLEAAPAFIFANTNVVKDPNFQGKQLMYIGKTSLNTLEKIITQVR